MDYTRPLSDHVAVVCRSRYYQLRQLRAVVRCSSEDAAKTMSLAFVISRLDYCNALCYCITGELTRCLQWVQNDAARLVTGTRRRVQDCVSRLPVLVLQHPWLLGQRLPARRRRSNIRCRSDAHQLWKHDRKTTSLEQCVAQSQTL